MKQSDLLKNFERIFPKKIVEDDDTIPETDRVGYMDSTQIVMVIPKLKSIKELIKQNFDVKESKTPNLNYDFHFISGAQKNKFLVVARLKGEEIELQENKVKLSADYLKIILKLCSKTTNKDGIIIKAKKDYPVWIETDELICILAPRVS